MIITNDIRYGLDVKLHKIQQYLDIKLNAIIYGQLHENDREDGKVLEWSIDEKEVFVDDNENMVIGFRVINKSVNDYVGVAELDCIVTTKTDNREKTENEIYKHLANSGYINEITGVKIGIADVFTGLFNDRIKYRDIYPYHVFAFTIEVNYNYSIC